MPGIDGLELVRSLRERERTRGGRRLPVIVATAHAVEDDAQLLYQAGADAHLIKPFSLDALEAAVAQVTRVAAAAAG